MSHAKKSAGSLLQAVVRWFDAYAIENIESEPGKLKVDWIRAIPFVVLHLSVLFVFLVGWSPIAVTTAFILYLVRMFAITGFYHRYFSHKAFKTSRVTQFIFSLLASSAVQRGPLWWASHHRLHHKNSDNGNDEHSPKQHGFMWSHMGWFLAKKNFPPKLDYIKDFVKFPELKFIDRFDVVMPVVLGTGLFVFGEFLYNFYPELNTNGWQMFIWGFVVSTLFLYHITFTINSFAHTIGSRRFKTKDDSRNNWFLAIITLGEGWHNNHHYYPCTARQGFTWWEIDFTYYILKSFEKCGLIWDLKELPDRIKEKVSDLEVQK
ncbi:MAG: acyl-CoA desaturase [Gammaproteobacteria bacterium]|nr:acyl-CoA desaturase [Gammaproteobacteria bacterium]